MHDVDVCYVEWLVNFICASKRVVLDSFIKMAVLSERQQRTGQVGDNIYFEIAYFSPEPTRVLNIKHETKKNILNQSRAGVL